MDECEQERINAAHADLAERFREAVEKANGKPIIMPTVMEPEPCPTCEVEGVTVGPYVYGQMPSSYEVPSSGEVPSSTRARPGRAVSSGGPAPASAYAEHYTEAEDRLAEWYPERTQPSGIYRAHLARPGGYIEHGPVHTPARDTVRSEVKPPLTPSTSQRGPWDALVGIVDKAWNWCWYDWRPYVWPSMRTPIDPATSTDPNVRYAGEEGLRRFLDDLANERNLATAKRSRWRWR
jgi:hypothetical protein